MNFLGTVVQSIVSLTSPLRGQLVWFDTTLWPKTLIFLLKKIREAFAVQKLFTFFSAKKYIGVFEVLAFKILAKTLTNNIISFEQPGPGLFITIRIICIVKIVFWFAGASGYGR